MKKIQTKDLSCLTILNEMALELLSNSIDEAFYEDYVYKDISWLIKNKNKILNDFYNNIDKLEGGLKLRCKYINMFEKETIYKIIERL